MTKGKSPLRLSVEKYLHNPLAVLGAGMLGLIIFMALFPQVLTHYSPSMPNIMNTDAPPSPLHPLGTDSSGYDNLARLLYGGRVDLTVAFAAALMALFIGVVYGGISGYVGGWIDQLLMRFVDVMLNFPFIIMVLVIESVLNVASAWMLIVAVGITAWPVPARLLRGLFLQLREQEYVLSAITVGATSWRIITRHLLPNAISFMLVYVSFQVAAYVGLDAALSYLGLVVPVSVPSWGGMLNTSADYLTLRTAPYAWAPPAAMIVLTVLSVNFIGDGLRDAFDPHTRP